MTRTREELAWAGGFFAGEGSTYLSAGRGRMSINQNDPEVLLRFQDAVGMGTVTGPYERTGGNAYWTYAVSGWVKVQAVTAMLWPWLGTLKQEQATRAMASMIRETPLGHRTVCKRGHSYEGNRTTAGQCRPCMRLYKKNRRLKAQV